jgi:hypothetical protein
MFASGSPLQAAIMNGSGHVADCVPRLSNAVRTPELSIGHNNAKSTENENI